MENIKTKSLIVCDNLAEAHILQGKLENEGINCFLTNENFTNLMPLYNNMLNSGIHIMINELDYDKARELVKDKINPDIEDLVCPNCGSSNIVLGLGKIKGFKIFNVLIALLCFIPIGNLKPKYYCKQCKNEF